MEHPAVTDITRKARTKISGKLGKPNVEGCKINNKKVQQ
jgi:hypothetical protein